MECKIGEHRRSRVINSVIIGAQHAGPPRSAVPPHDWRPFASLPHLHDSSFSRKIPWPRIETNLAKPTLHGSFTRNMVVHY